MKNGHRSAFVLKICNYGLSLFAIIYLIEYLYIVSSRIAYPFELEWMEGGSVDHVVRILSGQQLYIEPSIEFIPFAYTPLFYYVSALVSKLTGVGFFPLRLVSFLSSLGSFALIFEIVRRETKSRRLALLSMGLFVATFKLSGAWLDIARVDSLFLMLLLASTFLLRFYSSSGSLLLAGLLIFLSFLTKQTALPIAVAMCVYSLFYLEKRSRFVYPSVILLLLGSSTPLFNWLSHGWYVFYVFNLPKHHPIIRSMFWDFWRKDIGHLSIAFCISTIYLVFLIHKKRSSAFAFYFLLSASMFGGAWLSRLLTGGYVNVLLPAYASIAILFGLGVHVLTSSSLWQDPAGSASTKHLYYELLLVFLCGYQFVTLQYNPVNQIPTEEDRAAGLGFVQLLKQREGEAFLPFHGFIPSLAGKKTYAQGMAMNDILLSNDQAKRERLRESLADAIRNKEFGTIILDKNWWKLEQDIEKEYRLIGSVFEDDDVFWPVTGMKTRPQRIYEVRPP